ncbi:MAG: hypothetical protein K6G23_11145, partial [Lachnospiraceae bacterium]|nr:hypothetical protein [Lachnospiraceae bacterium]
RRHFPQSVVCGSAAFYGTLYLSAKEPNICPYTAPPYYRQIFSYTGVWNGNISRTEGRYGWNE